MPPSPSSEELALAALEWIDATAVADRDGAWWSSRPSSDEPDPGIYHGAAGIVLALLEAHAHFGDQRWAELALRGTRWLSSAIDAPEYASYPSLYVGLAGMAFALHEAAERFDDDGARAASLRRLAQVRAGFDGERWNDAFELLLGNAGIALAALPIGDTDLAETAVTPYLRTAEATPYGLTWEPRRGQPARLHHISHGNLGVAYALAATAAAVGRQDLMDAALAGVANVTAGNEAGPDGFLVPHSDPQQVAFGLERYAYGWCHGPAGDVQLFRLLAQLTGDAAWRSLVSQCWHTVTTSGLPARLRPGFWDNSGRCCGTAGVLALACDREAEDGDGLAFAGVLVTTSPSGRPWTRPGRAGRTEHRAARRSLNPGQAGRWATPADQGAPAVCADHRRTRSVLRRPVARPAAARRSGDGAESGLSSEQTTNG